MRSELLYMTEQAYISDTIEDVELFDGAFLQMFGRGEGSMEWPRPRGISNGRISHSVELTRSTWPDITGVIRLAGYDRPILYRMHGISLLANHRDRRLFAGPLVHR